MLGAYGDGGATITSDDEVERNLRRLRYYGMEKTYYVVETPGHNSRLDEVQAEILRRKLRRLDRYIADRRAVAARYADGLGDTELVLPALAEGNDHVYYVYVVRHPRRDDIIEALKAYDIQLNISYPWPVHTMTGLRPPRLRPRQPPGHREAGRRDLLAADVPVAARRRPGQGDQRAARGAGVVVVRVVRQKSRLRAWMLR